MVTISQKFAQGKEYLSSLPENMSTKQKVIAALPVIAALLALGLLLKQHCPQSVQEVLTQIGSNIGKVIEPLQELLGYSGEKVSHCAQYTLHGLDRARQVE